jgi:hypothetical protein
MAAKLVLPGRTVESAPEPELDAYLEVDVLCTQVVDGAARSATARASVLDDVAEDDIVELEFQDGIKQWVSVAQLRVDLAAQGNQRGVVEDETVRIPATLPHGRRSRGAADWVLKGLKVLRIDPAEAVAAKTIQEIVEIYEGKTVPNPGLYRLGNPPQLESNQPVP